MPRTLGLDFGTSNTAAGILQRGVPHLIEVEPGETTLPTSVFFDAEDPVILFGSDANTALFEGREGRFMRALKSVLGTPLMRELRWVGHARLRLLDVVARFIAEVKTRAEAGTGERFDTALSGRPVHFHSTDTARDARALADLAECYRLAGFRDVRFLYEPEAAALAYGELAPGTTGLIVDIGGGTSDFTVFRGQGDGIDILASHGIRLGGTDFDRVLSVAHVMPLLGQGSDIRFEFGSRTHIAPNAIFRDLATWEKIPFLYTPQTRREVAQMHQRAMQPHLLGRLARVLEHELGHDLAFAVEAGKIAVNQGEQGAIKLNVLEQGLNAALTPADLDTALAGFGTLLEDAARHVLDLAGRAPVDIGTVIFVGGSSLMSVVEGALRRVCPDAALSYGDAFTAIADGLAIAAARPFGDHPA